MLIRSIASRGCRLNGDKILRFVNQGGSSRIGRESASQAPRVVQLVAYRRYQTTSPAQKQKKALVLGSSGALGTAVSRFLSRELGMFVVGADVLELPNESDWDLDDFVAMPHFRKHSSLSELTTHLTKGVGMALGHEEIHAVVVASGGWQGDPSLPGEGASQEEVEAGAASYGEYIEKMMRMNLYPVVAAGYVAQRYMAENGLFVVIGATAALSPTPGMMGYGLAKTAAHHYVQTLGATTGLAVTSKSQRKESRELRREDKYLDTLTVVGILPTTIDTQSNRMAMPKADFSQWTKPIDIAKEVGTWMKTPALRPHSGSLVKVQSGHDGSQFHLVR